MATDALVRHLVSPQSLCMALGTAVLIGGIVSFSGWAFNAPPLTDWFDDGVSIQPNTSVLLSLAGIALILVHSGPRWAVAMLGAVIAVMGALTLSQYIVGADFGFNHQLTFGREWGQFTTVSRGRMGPPASTSFVFLGTALLLLGLRPELSARLRRWVPILGVAVCVIGVFSLIGRLYDATPLYTAWLTAIALQTVCMLLAVAAALIISVPEHQPVRLLLSDSGAGALARRIVPALIFLPPLLGWLRNQGQLLGYYDTGTGRALLVLSMAILSVGLLWWALLALARHEASDHENAMRNLQDQQRVAETLRHADRRKNEFLAILAHELRGPLAPLRNSLELIKRADRDELLHERARSIMDRQLSHLARLVEDLIDVSRISRDRIEIRKESVDLCSLFAACIEANRPFADERGQQMRVEFPGAALYVDADPVRLTQVFNNILNNASKYTGTGGGITCSLAQRHDHAVVTVRDTGIGIPPQELDRVFEMFTQIERGPEWARGGLGIGLTLAKRLVELHGGSIVASSSGQGDGSEFVVQLPLAQLQSAGVRPDRATPVAATESRRILVVDDNVDTAASLSALFRLAGHQTAVAHDGSSALETAVAFIPDAILLDIGLPGMSGYDTCRRLRAQPWGVTAVIIALTGWGQPADREKSREAGFDHHLVKPVEFPALLALAVPASPRQSAG